MNKGMLIIGLIVMALFGLTAINLITSQQTGAELDYYLLKDTTEAAMNDAIDYDFYSREGLVRMDKEKFAESFVRRFADGVNANRGYIIKFYDINETPPKVSVAVESDSNFVKKEESTKISTRVDMIIENDYIEDKWTTEHIKETSSSTTVKIMD